MSLVSYKVTCSAANGAPLSASKTVDGSINSVDLGDFELGDQNSNQTVTCCVTAQQADHSDYRACSSPNTGLPITAIIGGASAGAAVIVIGIIAGFILAMVCYIRKRYDNILHSGW